MLAGDKYRQPTEDEHEIETLRQKAEPAAWIVGERLSG